MSFDVFLQGFQNGDGARGKPEDAALVLLPYLQISPTGLCHIVTDDGEAEVYGIGTEALMFTHASGREVWDVIVQVARAGNWAIIPVGCPTCVPALGMVDDLPEELRVEAVVVNCGAEVIDAVIRT